MEIIMKNRLLTNSIYHNIITIKYIGNILLILRSLQTRNIINPRTIQQQVLITTSQSLSIIIRTQDPSNIKHQNPNVYFPPPPDTDDLRRWHCRGQGRPR